MSPSVASKWGAQWTTFACTAASQKDLTRFGSPEDVLATVASSKVAQEAGVLGYPLNDFLDIVGAT